MPVAAGSGYRASTAPSARTNEKLALVRAASAS
jgi:hypothetical protein